MPVPEAYYQFVMDYAPYLYIIPGEGPDLTWGKAALAAGFAVDFLYEAYFDPQFDDRSAEIEAKIVELTNWMLTQQITDDNREGYGGFVSAEGSTYCYAVDAGRTMPALLKAYELTSNENYLNSAKSAGTFLLNVQQKPRQLGIHDRYYGGFARAVNTADAWLPQMDVEALYSVVGLRLLAESDPLNKAQYQTIIEDAVNFYRPGLEQIYLYFDPKPSGDNAWHRVGLRDDIIYDDSVAYALLGLYDYEGYSKSVQKTYQAINAIGASPQFPAYNSGICWAGYINVKTKQLACDYYDAVTAGILGNIRQRHDKPAYDFSAKTILSHAQEFMFWGPRQTDYVPIENKQAMATVCWLGEMLSGYQPPLTRFTQVLRSKGENLTLHPLTEAGDSPAYGEPTDLKAIVLPQKTEEMLIEPGYLVNDYLTVHVFAPIRRHDKVTRNGTDYEVTTTQDFMLKSDVAFRKATLRRLHNQ